MYRRSVHPVRSPPVHSRWGDVGAGAVASTLDGTLGDLPTRSGGDGDGDRVAPRYTLVTLPNWSTVATSASLLVHSTVT